MSNHRSIASAAVGIAAVVSGSTLANPRQDAPPAAPRPVTPAAASTEPLVPGAHTVEFAGSPVAFTTAGTGESVLLFVHGWSCNQEFWNEQMKDAALQEGRTLVAIDLPGHGKSPAPADGKLSMERFDGAMAAVLDAVHAKKAVLVGHSNGTPMVRDFARRNPGRAAAIVAADGALRSFFADSAAVEQFLAPLRGPKWKETAADFVDGMLPRSMLAERRDFIRARMLATSQATMVADFEAVNEKGVQGDDPIRVPLLVLNARSPSWTPGYEAFVRKLAPQVDYQTMTGVSHFLMMDAPEEFDRRLVEFLEKNDL